MQAAEEVPLAEEDLLDASHKELSAGEVFFLHTDDPTAFAVWEQDFPVLYLGKSGGLLTYVHSGTYDIPSPGRDSSKTSFGPASPRGLFDIKNWILSQPSVKGILFDLGSGLSWKYRLRDPVISSDIFPRMFPRSRITNTFQEDVWNHLRTLYLQWDDPTKSPIHGKCEEVWMDLLPDYCIYKQNTIHINELPRSVDPDTLKQPSLHTVRRTIRELKRGYRKEVRSSKRKWTR